MQVTIRLNTYLEAEDVATLAPDAVVVATGSLPSEDGFQRALPDQITLPGIETGRVWSTEEVMGRSARIGDRVVVVDEGGNWRGCGTAWWLAEAGRTVTLVTPDPLIGKELQRSAADYPLRQRLAQLGVEFVTESAVRHWGPDGATIMSFLTGDQRLIPADDLVMATANRAEDLLARDLDGTLPVHLIGDAAGPRQAPYAIHDGRKIGLAL